MSLSRKAFFLPQVFPKELFTLGQFVCNPLTPTIFPFTDVLPGEITEADPENNYERAVSVDRRGWLGFKIPQLSTFGGEASSGTLLCIKAKEMLYRTLKNPDTVFNQTVNQKENAQEWLNAIALQRTKAYMVVGLEELKDAQFFKARAVRGEGGVWMTIPIDNIPLQLGGQFSRNASAFATSTVNGIFGIEVREITLHERTHDEPKLSNKVSWRFSYERIKGEQDDEGRNLCAELGQGPSTATLEELHANLEMDEDEDDEM